MKTGLITVGIIAAGVLGYFLYMGAFTGVRIEEQDRPAIAFVYRDIAGSEMSLIGPTTDQLDTLLTRAGVASRKPLDIFYPDGRAEIGFAVDGASEAQLASLGAAAKSRVIPAQRYMTSSFPWTSSASYMIGYMKVDPALAKWRAAHHYKKVEAFALNEGKTILYLQPIVPAAP